MIRIATGLTVFWLTMCAATAQPADTAGDVDKGHYLAVRVCAVCHVAAPDQTNKPLLNPPASSFAAIMQRKDVTADWLENFIATTHRGLDNPKGMPNPDLAAYQVKQVVAYMMSLRK